MGEQFLLEDIFNVMIELETLGHKIYSKMSQLTPDYKLKELFENLSHAELAHKEIYTCFKKEIIVFNREHVNDEYKNYIKSMLNQTIDFLNQNEKIEDFEAGYSVAVRLEEDTLLFLMEIRKIVNAQFHQAIDEIIEEERMHLKSLNEYKSDLK